jgi:hypothetical protein
LNGSGIWMFGFQMVIVKLLQGIFCWAEIHQTTKIIATLRDLLFPKQKTNTTWIHVAVFCESWHSQSQYSPSEAFARYILLSLDSLLNILKTTKLLCNNQSKENNNVGESCPWNWISKCMYLVELVQGVLCAMGVLEAHGFSKHKSDLFSSIVVSQSVPCSTITSGSVLPSTL